MMKFIVLALLTARAHAAPKCYTGDEPINGMKPKDIIPNVLGQLAAAAQHEMDADTHEGRQFKAFMQSRGKCQLDCMTSQTFVTANTLLGRQGKKFGDPSTKDLGVEALTGAFMSCFPSPPRDVVHRMITKIVATMGAPSHGGVNTHDPFKDNKACEVPAKAFPMDDFVKHFGDTFVNVVNRHDGLKKFFETEAKDCQVSCLKSTIPQAALVLFMTMNDNKEEGIKSLTGASRACFPGVPREDIKGLVTMVVNEFEKSVDEGKKSELYDANMKVGTMSLSSFPTIGVAAVAMGLVMFMGVVVGKRIWIRQQSREPRELLNRDEELAPIE